MLRRRSLLVTSVVFALLTACTAKVVPAKPAQVVAQVGPTVDELTPEQLCSRLPLGVVNAAVPVPFTEARPGVVDCRYATEFDPNDSSAPRPMMTVSADLMTGAPDDTALDGPFRDESDNVVEYQRIGGVGDDAAHGPYPRTPDTTQLTFLSGVDNGYWDVVIRVEHPDAGGITLDHLRALAEQVLDVLPS